MQCDAIHNTNIHVNNNNISNSIIIYSNFLKVNCFPCRNLSESIFPLFKLQSKHAITTFAEFSFL
jgi:hypothetical protein